MAKILVADDKRDIRGLLTDILLDADHEVIQATNGEDALEKARDESPDLILLDVAMPVMDGFEALERLRGNMATKAIPVVMITSLPQQKGQLRGWKLGAAHYITKPFDPGMVATAIRVALREVGIES